MFGPKLVTLLVTLTAASAIADEDVLLACDGMQTDDFFSKESGYRSPQEKRSVNFSVRVTAYGGELVIIADGDGQDGSVSTSNPDLTDFLHQS